ncbi:MAG: tetratricopeptide repeat protein [Cellvibrionaceae bacterium]
MAQHLTEEEQLEKLKQWWAENGRFLVIGVLLAVVGYFGWQTWQSQQQQAREEASLLYDDLMSSVERTPGEALTEEQRLKADSITQELKSDYGKLLYASNAALLMAKLAVEEDDLEQAEQHLRWVLGRNHSEAISLLARLRLGQVLYGQGQYERALAALADAEPGSYTSAYAELRGDILVAKEQPAQAKAAYQVALDELLPAESNRANIIQMKLDDIQANATEAQAAEVDN